jgi:hypothetical protein|tara:strand:+ start:4067 stop:4957 length:891 start_codon:yes stop_codon:yes gene_type:complete
MEKINLICFLSMERSGSTILDLMLNNHPDIQSVGEFRQMSKWYTHNYKCSCKKKINECSFWIDVIENVKKYNSENDIQHIIHNLDNMPLWERRFIRYFKIPDESFSFKIAINNYYFFKSVMEKSKKKIILDSSKDLARILILARSGLFNIRCIHLVRNGMAYVNSINKAVVRPAIGGNERTKSYNLFRSSIIFVLKNKRILSLRANFDKYILVRYEDIVTDTERTMKKICTNLNLDYSDCILIPNKNNIHNISGSRWRFVEDNTLILDEKWKHQLSPTKKFIFNLFASRINRQLGY